MHKIIIQVLLFVLIIMISQASARYMKPGCRLIRKDMHYSSGGRSYGNSHGREWCFVKCMKMDNCLAVDYHYQSHKCIIHHTYSWSIPNRCCLQYVKKCKGGRRHG